MALMLPFIGPTAHPTRNEFYLPVRQNELNNTVNAPLVGIARSATNLQPALNLPVTLANMARGYNPRVLPKKVV